MSTEPTPHPVSFATALRFWFKLGCISFGGPTGQIAIMHQELVERRRWISEPRFLHALNFCMLLPGPEAQQLATYIGWLLHGIRGGVAAGALFVLPSLFLLLTLSWIYLAFGAVPEVAGVLYGVKPAVIAIVLFAAWRLGSRTLRDPVLTAAQMIDGLALGETTPGPLIMVVTFVGFVGGWTHDPLGAALPAWSGIVGGLVATWFTFLPSFLFIFAGAPLVERTRGDHEFTAPLVAVTAAVVGVIVNLAVYFAAHVLWPGGATLDWLAVAITLGAFVALWRFKVGVIPVIAACALLGLLRALLGT